jgi:hypothetical protein
MGPDWWQATDGKWYPPNMSPASLEPPAPAEPPQLSARSVLLMVAVVLAGFWLWTQQAGDDGPREQPVVSTASWERDCPGEPVQVIYGIGGTARRASLTYHNATGAIEQNGSVNPHPAIKFCSAAPFFSISAQNEGAAGTISCTIAVDGELVSQAESSGGYAIASC